MAISLPHPPSVVFSYPDPPFSVVLDVLHHQHTEEFETKPADTLSNNPQSCMISLLAV